MENQTYGFVVGEALHTVYQYVHAGAKQGLDLEKIQEAIAVELAIQSGDLALPWSQEDCEDFGGYGPTIEDTQRLMAQHPEFTPVARAWAYGKSPEMFYTFWEQQPK